jgi:hypothetical protein
LRAGDTWTVAATLADVDDDNHDTSELGGG